MSFTYDPTTNIGRVRRTLPDKDMDEAFWSDEEIDSFLVDEGNDWRLATALALETIASDELLVIKSIRIQNIETNADRYANVLLKRAASLREQAVAADAASSDAFDFAEIIVTDDQYRQRIYNQALRQRV